MKLAELDYQFPEELIAKERALRSRILSGLDNEIKEINFEELLEQFLSGDVLVVNNTKVLRRRVFTLDDIEMLFLKSTDQLEWEVLFPSAKYKVGSRFTLPENVEVTLTQKGRPQKVVSNKPLDESYFETHGELPLPPYIQKARDERHNRGEDKDMYQTCWAEKPGSFAAPTASFHFSDVFLQKLRDRGVSILQVTLHVGLGTFLPVNVENLKDHVMHSESVEVPEVVWNQILSAKKKGCRIWALGTTVTRALESAALGNLATTGGSLVGETQLMITPGFEFKIVDGLLTNFHQPKSTLLALVSAFAGLEKVKGAYAWAIERKFRLFSYGDLTVWKRGG